MTKEEIIQKLFEYVDGSKDWVLQEAPELFQQIATYGFYKGLISCGISFLVFIFSLFFGWKCLCNIKTVKYVIGYKCCGIALVISFICFCCEIEPCIKAAVAPKLYILDYLRGK